MDETASPEASDARFRRVLGQYPTGVCVVTGITQDGQPTGLAVGSFTSLSLHPPLVAFMPDKTSSSWPKIRPANAFCVNILSAGQESVCRAFAARAPDKFRDVSWRAASSGSPVITGVVAWIDCDLERVHEAGDHEIVIGRVRELEIESHSLPLLFFRGGYGRFAPLSMAANDVAFSEHLRIVDLARGEMDQAAAALDCQVVAMSIVGHELVLLASAGGLDDPTWATVGQRYPAVAPIGSNIMAWQEPDQIGSWLSGVESSQQRRTYLRRLEQARQRGYSVMMDSPYRSRLTEMAGQHRLPGTYAEMSAEQRKTLAGLPIDPLDFSAAQAHKVRFIYVPVFGVDGTAPISLGVRLTHSLDSPQQLKCYVRHMQEVSDRVTESIGGSIPSREKIQ